jgi:hypothetical protein
VQRVRMTPPRIQGPSENQTPPSAINAGGVFYTRHFLLGGGSWLI